MELCMVQILESFSYLKNHYSSQFLKKTRLLGIMWNCMGKVTSWYGAEKLGVLYITFFADSSRNEQPQPFVFRDCTQQRCQERWNFSLLGLMEIPQSLKSSENSWTVVVGCECQECMWLIVHQTKLLNLLTMSTFADQARYSLLLLLNSSVYRLLMF